MANVKFTEFPSAATVGGTDIIPIVQGGINKKATGAVFSTYIGSAFVALTGNQTIAGVKTFSSQLVSTIATGTAPFSVASTTKVTNLNADLLDGLSSADFQLALTNPITGTGTTNYLPKFTGSTALGNSILIDGATSINLSGVGNALTFDTTGQVGSSVIKTVEDFKLSLKSNRGTTSEIKIGNENLEFLTNSVERLTIAGTGAATFSSSVTTGGNLGVGVTPSTATGFRYIQFGAGAALSTNNTNNSNFYHNTTFDASGNALYAVTGQQSSYYRQINGQHVWAYAAAGTAGNAITFTNNMVLDSVGSLQLLRGISLSGATAPASGIQFPATQVASANNNNLDDYEEGTWTMGLSFGGGTTGITYSANTGQYTKIGRQVTITGYLLLTNKGTSTGAAVVTGLPFTTGTLSSYFSAPSLLLAQTTFLNTYTGIIVNSSSSVALKQVTDLGVSSNLTNANFANNSEIIVTLTYFV